MNAPIYRRADGTYQDAHGADVAAPKAKASEAEAPEAKPKAETPKPKK